MQTRVLRSPSSRWPETHLPCEKKSWPPSQQPAGRRLQPALRATSWQTPLTHCTPPEAERGTKEKGVRHKNNHSENFLQHVLLFINPYKSINRPYPWLPSRCPDMADPVSPSACRLLPSRHAPAKQVDNEASCTCFRATPDKMWQNVRTQTDLPQLGWPVLSLREAVDSSVGLQMQVWTVQHLCM